MTKLKWIYYLIDPFTKKVRYVGSSFEPTKRFAHHLSKNDNPSKFKWINSLKKRGVVPELRFVVQGDKEDIKKLESKHIRKFDPKDLFNRRAEDRDRRIEFRLKPEEFFFVVGLAEKFSGGNVSVFIRWAVNYSIKHGSEELKKYLNKNLKDGKKIIVSEDL